MRNEDTIVGQLAEVKTIIKDFKTKQGIAGDSWRVYRAETNNEPYDLYFTGLNTSPRFIKRWKITYQIDGGRKIPNAFALFYNKFDATKTVTGMFGDTYEELNGFDYNDENAYDDPLSCYLVIGAGYNWDATANSNIGVKFRAISPYKGRIIFEEIY